jgi:hypothetical protein
MKSGKDPDGSARSIADQITIVNATHADLSSRRSRLIEAIETGQDAPASVLDRINVIEAEIEQLDIQLKKLQLNLIGTQGIDQLTAEAVEVVQGLLNDLKTKTGDQLYLLRASLNEHLRHLLLRIEIFPGGTVSSAKEAREARKDLASTGRYSKSQVDEHIASTFSTTPDKNRHFLFLANRSGERQILRPDDEFPDFHNALIETPELVAEWVAKRKARITQS